jgi:hypothetical protein
LAVDDDFNARLPEEGDLASFFTVVAASAFSNLPTAAFTIPTDATDVVLLVVLGALIDLGLVDNFSDVDLREIVPTIRCRLFRAIPIFFGLISLSSYDKLSTNCYIEKSDFAYLNSIRELLSIYCR